MSDPRRSSFFFSDLFTDNDKHDESQSPRSVRQLRTFHDFDAAWFAHGKRGVSSAADAKLWILRCLCGQVARITFGVLVFVYLWLTFIAISLDLGAYCINGKHGQMDMKHLEPVDNPTHVTHYMDKHTSDLRKRGRTLGGIMSPEEEEARRQVEGLLQVPQAMLRGAKEKVMVCDEPMASGGAVFAETLGFSCLFITAAQLTEHLLRMYALSPMFFFTFFSLKLDFFFTLTGFCGDVAINFFLRPWAVQNVELQRPQPGVIYVLFALRLWRCTMLWRLIRSIWGDFSAGSELLWAFQGLEVISCREGGMAKASVAKVTIIKCTHTDTADYRSKRSILRKIHGLKCSQKLLFYGTLEGSIGLKNAEETARVPLARSLVPAVHKLPLVYGAERPIYVDSCYGFVSGGEGFERQMILMKAIVANPELANKEQPFGPNGTNDPSLKSVSTESMTATERLGLAQKSTLQVEAHYDCIFSNEVVDPPDYKFDSLEAEMKVIGGDFGLAKRDVGSTLYGFHEKGLLMPVAIIHYTNPDAEDEIQALRKVGSQSWPDFCRPYKNLTTEQRDGLIGLERVIEKRDVEALEPALERCRELKVNRSMREVLTRKQEESENAGIGVEYLMAEESVESLNGKRGVPLAELARTRTGKQDPSFIEMRDPFFMEPKTAIGSGLLCPRDLRPGCAFIDSLARRYRKKATHFMSWVWGYKLSVVQGALRRFITANDEHLIEEDMFLFVCFFCNNQWRILIEKSSAGADNLETVFEARLRQIGRVVAVMDRWENPIYTQRIWTIYEQYVATKLGIVVQFSLPQGPAEDMFKRIEAGKKGIQYVVQTISKVDAESSQATFPDDEKKVKDMIRGSVGFPTVNEKVQKRIVEWLSDEFKGSISAMVEASSPSRRKTLESIDGSALSDTSVQVAASNA